MSIKDESDSRMSSSIINKIKVVDDDSEKNVLKSKPKLKKSGGEEDEMAMMFGSRIHELFDGIHDRIDATLRDGVSSLPFLPPSENDEAGSNSGGGGEEKLLAILRCAYIQNMDLVETYAKRNVFAIPSHYTYKQRACILKGYLSEADGDVDTDADADSDAGNQTEDTTGKQTPAAPQKTTIAMPTSRDDIPTQDQINALRNEIDRLRNALRNAKIRRNNLQSKISKIQSLSASLSTAKRKFHESIGAKEEEDGDVAISNVHQSVSATMIGKEGLEDMNFKGEKIIQQMDEIKTIREEQRKDGTKDGQETMELDEAMKIAAQEAENSLRYGSKRKKLTLEEEFQQRRQAVQLEGDDLQVSSDLLKKK